MLNTKGNYDFDKLWGCKRESLDLHLGPSSPPECCNLPAQTLLQVDHIYRATIMSIDGASFWIITDDIDEVCKWVYIWLFTKHKKYEFRETIVMKAKAIFNILCNTIQVTVTKPAWLKSIAIKFSIVLVVRETLFRNVT